jgi:hypothetical protein
MLPPPLTVVVSTKPSVAMFSPTFCKVDWRLFDPETLSWEFHGEKSLEALKGLTAAQAS